MQHLLNFLVEYDRNLSQFIVLVESVHSCRNYERCLKYLSSSLQQNMTVLVYFTSASLECYNQFTDMITKIKLTRDKQAPGDIF